MLLSFLLLLSCLLLLLLNIVLLLGPLLLLLLLLLQLVVLCRWLLLLQGVWLRLWRGLMTRRELHRWRLTTPNSRTSLGRSSTRVCQLCSLGVQRLPQRWSQLVVRRGILTSLTISVERDLKPLHDWGDVLPKGWSETERSSG